MVLHQVIHIFSPEKTLFGRNKKQIKPIKNKKTHAGTATQQHPDIKINTRFWGGEKAPAGTATPQHPGFKIKHMFGPDKTKKTAPAGTATPQHPGFVRSFCFCGILGCVLQVINLFLAGNY